MVCLPRGLPLHNLCGRNERHRQEEPQVPPLRCAPVGMTILLQGQGFLAEAVAAISDSSEGNPSALPCERAATMVCLPRGLPLHNLRDRNERHRQEKPQVPPLRYAPVGMTILLQGQGFMAEAVAATSDSSEGNPSALPCQWAATMVWRKSARWLWIGRPLGKHGIQSLVMTVDIVKKVHRAVLLRDRSYVQKKHRDFHSQIHLAIVSAGVHRTLH